MANNVVWAKPVLLVEAGKTEEVITFCKAAFGAAEVETMDGSSEINICGLSIVIQDTAQGPAVGGNSQIPVLPTEDDGAAVAKAVSAGAVELELDEWDAEFNGGLMGKVRDPYGFVWHIRHRSCML